ncbi:protein-glutamate O-methyltransferase CheR [Rapidithrix thailandica]|uniref:protein-glutamate O-methyltransferase n=1 Tax=Rapidithrix thailandica TaxID=413964 RepID=A0AAW9S4M4_9BACT
MPENNYFSATKTMHEIEINEIRRLTKIIQDNYGFDFKDYAISSFRRRISRIIDLYKFKSVDALINRLNSQPEFFEEFLSEITVNVTEMYRDPSFWKEIRDHVIPQILLNNNKLSIWHAGCSSGEEVYSMCILLEEMGLLDKANVIATDIDTAIISRAKQGKISKKNMVLNDKNYHRFGGNSSLDKYFDEDRESYTLKSDLLNKVSFRKHDLVKGFVFSKFDLVLCRNVMIYFNQTLQNNVLYKLHESLFKYGYLAIGSKESLIWCDIANKFLVVNNEEKIYRKIKE